MEQTEPLIKVSLSHILLTASPLLLVALISTWFELNLESPLLVGTVRTFVQLSVLSLILDPIFSWGVDLWWVVVGYTMFMVLLAALESTSRSKYYFDGMFWYVLITLLANIAGVSIFAFGLILEPTPIWSPQYVIPIVGMLLGNCINGISLSLNAMLTSMVESSREVELLLSFGASSYEASARLLKDSVRIGTMPQLNSMAIIGIISIPGMMTGQILGGSIVTDAARYQILIIYLIATSSFGTILTQHFLLLGVCFDSQMIHRTDRLHRRAKKENAMTLLTSCLESAWNWCRRSGEQVRRLSSSFSNGLDEAKYLAPKGQLLVRAAENPRFGVVRRPILSVSGIKFSFERKEEEDLQDVFDEEKSRTRRILFENVSFEVLSGEIALVQGPSGVGKSTMMRILAGLQSPDEGSIEFLGANVGSCIDMPSWRKQILYVPQTKVDIPGTPNDLMQKISSFGVCSRLKTPSYTSLKSNAQDFVREWGMNPILLDSEWSTLSGGESQRILLALALSSKPRVILLDESTSALDIESKIRIERSVANCRKSYGMCAVWISHDQAQVQRLERN